MSYKMNCKVFGEGSKKSAEPKEGIIAKNSVSSSVEPEKAL